MRAPRYDGSPLADTRGRPLRDLRISVTDRCNFRCTYCMPREVFDADYKFLPHAAILSFEEIARLAGVFVGLGVKKIRLTGGEPLLRKDLPRLVAMLAPLGADLTLTTNGSTLVKHAQALKDAGLDRITVSLDSLDEATFRAMNDADFPVEKVLDGIAAAANAGFSADQDQHGGEARRERPPDRRSRAALARIRAISCASSSSWTSAAPTAGAWTTSIPSAEVVRRISAAFPLEQVEANYAGEVAERWRYKDGAGEIGVISSVTQAFCADCNRMRLSTEGSLYTCLFAQQGHDLKSLLRGGASDDAIRDSIAAVWRVRDDRYSEIRTATTEEMRAKNPKVEMSYIGG